MNFGKVTDEFTLAVENAVDLDELERIIDAMAREMGFRHFALTHHVDLPRTRQPVIRLHNYPPGWEEYFDAERLGPCDPVHRASHMTTAGFHWSRLGGIIELTPRDRMILERSWRAGIGEGFTVPAHVPGESAGSCSFAMARGQTMRREWLPLVQHIGATAFDGARRLSGVRLRCADRPSLTDRQRDCLFWAARGKSDWEISVILGLAHQTVVQYMKQARGRYGVQNRTQLSIHALYDGALTFTDALAG